MARITTLEPVTLDGWYERTDGRVGEYSSSSPGLVRCRRVVASWADVPSRDEDLQAAIDAGAI